MKVTFKLKRYGLRPESVGTVSLVAVLYVFTEFGHRSIVLNLRREPDPLPQG